MSLINEALKKAQRERTEEPATPVAPVAAGTVRIAKRSKAPSANTMVLVGSGAVVLVVLSVVVTVFLLNRTDTPSAPPAKASVVTPATQTAPTVAETPAPVIASGLPPTTTTAPVTDPVIPAVSTVPAPMTSSPSSTVTPAPEPAVAAATPASVTPSPAPGPNERVAAFVEAIRVTGIRSSGSESRVLMNERVYRVNDLVDRTLGVKLVGVAVDHLTFSDANGVTYTKNF